MGVRRPGSTAAGKGKRVSEKSLPIGETAPRGARIRRADGSVIECDLRRYPGRDWAGGAAWMATAPESVLLDWDGDRFECDSAPTGSVVCFAVPLLPGADGWPHDLGADIKGVTFESDFACPEGGTGMTWPTKPQGGGGGG